jgi:hypothetical protein
MFHDHLRFFIQEKLLIFFQEWVSRPRDGIHREWVPNNEGRRPLAEHLAHQLNEHFTSPWIDAIVCGGGCYRCAGEEGHPSPADLANAGLCFKHAFETSEYQRRLRLEVDALKTERRELRVRIEGRCAALHPLHQEVEKLKRSLEKKSGEVLRTQTLRDELDRRLRISEKSREQLRESNTRYRAAIREGDRVRNRAADALENTDRRVQQLEGELRDAVTCQQQLYHAVQRRDDANRELSDQLGDAETEGAKRVGRAIRAVLEAAGAGDDRPLIPAPIDESVEP